MIDSADRRRLEETGIELNNILEEEQMANVPLLVLANKQDLVTALPPDEVCMRSTTPLLRTLSLARCCDASLTQISESLNLSQIRGRLWAIQPCSAETGEGLEEAMTWLVETIRK